MGQDTTTQTILFRKEPTTKSKVQFDAFDVGELVIEYDAGAFNLTIDGVDVDSTGAHYVLCYGIKQALADSYANETTYKKAQPKFAKKLQAIIDGDIVFDSSNRSADPVAVLARQLCRSHVLELKGESGEKMDAFRKRVGKATFATWFAAVWTANESFFVATATNMLATAKDRSGLVEVSLD